MKIGCQISVSNRNLLAVNKVYLHIVIGNAYKNEQRISDEVLKCPFTSI